MPVCLSRVWPRRREQLDRRELPEGELGYAIRGVCGRPQHARKYDIEETWPVASQMPERLLAWLRARLLRAIGFSLERGVLGLDDLERFGWGTPQAPREPGEEIDVRPRLVDERREPGEEIDVWTG